MAMFWQRETAEVAFVRRGLLQQILCQNCGTTGKMWEGRKTVWESSPVDSKVRERRRGSIFPHGGSWRTMVEQLWSCSPWWTSHQNSETLPKWRALSGAEESCEKGGAAQRNSFSMTPTTIPLPTPLVMKLQVEEA